LTGNPLSDYTQYIYLNIAIRRFRRSTLVNTIYKARRIMTSHDSFGQLGLDGSGTGQLGVVSPEINT